MAYPKEYRVFVCPPAGGDDGMYPNYDCEDMSVHSEPGKCPTCGQALEQASVSDTEFYLATYELMA